VTARPRPSAVYRACRRIYRRGRAPTVRERSWRGLRILAYHRVCDEDDVLAVSPEQFAEQMAILADADFVVRRLSEALDAPDADSTRAVCVTFDDGYRDNLTHALPVLRQYGIPATIFLPTGIIDGSYAYSWYSDPPPALSWAEVRELQDEGLVDFQAHTISHPRLPEVSDERARFEIIEGKGALEARLEREVSCLCYPAGRYGEREVELAREARYRLAVTTRRGVNTTTSPPYAFRRSIVDWQVDAERFRALLDGAFDRPGSLPRALRRLRLVPRI
jgi:peptidoglycan/xylan/chitin deacetylase (PgdA/CDA1 family)